MKDYFTKNNEIAKKICTNNKEKRESINNRMESLEVNHQAWDQYNIPANNAMSQSPKRLESSQKKIITLLLNDPHHTMQYQIPNIRRVLPEPIPPFSQYINHPLR